MKSRKLKAWIVGTIILVLNLIAIYFIKPDVVYVPVISFSIGSIVFLAVSYIGGTVYKDWIKSKHFRTELFIGKEAFESPVNEEPAVDEK